VMVFAQVCKIILGVPKTCFSLANRASKALNYQYTYFDKRFDLHKGMQKHNTKHTQKCWNKLMSPLDL
jgi:hypothetical protein